MIGYCPIEEEPPLRVPQMRAPSQKVPPRGSRMEDTETNYVVLFFIAGVLALAAMDSIKK
jgi:hypothetical protein